MPPNPHPAQTTIKLSLRGVFLGLIAIFAVGIIGGVFGAQVINPPLPPLTDKQQPLLTTVQEVTISPSLAAAQLVATHERAIVLLAQATGTAVQFQGTGVVLTNDGLVVSTEDIAQNAVAFDGTGERLSLSKIGADALYGLVYYRLNASVIPPFQLGTSDPAVGASLLAVGRSKDTLSPAAASWQVVEYQTPQGEAPPAWQRVLHMVSATSQEPADLAGTPLIADDGTLSGIIVDGAQGVAIPVSDIRRSLQRVTANQREANPFTTWGLSLTYDFTYNVDLTQRRFTATVTGVTPATPAAAARLVAGDAITHINDTEITWTTNIAELLTNSSPVQLTVSRDGQPQTITLNPSAP